MDGRSTEVPVGIRRIKSRHFSREFLGRIVEGKAEAVIVVGEPGIPLTGPPNDRRPGLKGCQLLLGSFSERAAGPMVDYRLQEGLIRGRLDDLGVTSERPLPASPPANRVPTTSIAPATAATASATSFDEYGAARGGRSPRLSWKPNSPSTAGVWAGPMAMAAGLTYI
jgi:hypothetical protein